jgi:hypothetical protein
LSFNLDSKQFTDLEVLSSARRATLTQSNPLRFIIVDTGRNLILNTACLTIKKPINLKDPIGQ